MAETRKLASHNAECRNIGVLFLLVVVETLGGWSPDSIVMLLMCIVFVVCMFWLCFSSLLCMLVLVHYYCRYTTSMENKFENCSFCTGICDVGGLFPIDNLQQGVYGK